MSVGAFGLRRWSAAAIAFAAGCFDPVASYLSKHPETPYRVAVAMKQGTVAPGMTKEVVRLVWGRPDEIRRTGIRTESWTYRRHIPGKVGVGFYAGYVVAFRGDVVVRSYNLGRVDGKTW